jgi:hypothetical protein
VIGVIVAVAMSGAVGYIASRHHGRGGGKWFLLSLVVSPLFGLLFLIAASGQPRAPEAPVQSPHPMAVKKCGSCGKDVRASATSCPHCGAAS